MKASRLWRRAAVMGVAIVIACAVHADASSWNEKTILTFSEPVMVPGATLQPGTYVFQLTEANSNRNLVQIRTQDGKVIATTQAVPMKRQDANGDVVLKFDPTDAGSPPALKGWFYPGTLYGHEFLYPEAQAKEIAQRTKSLVLSVDVPGTDIEKGTLHTFNQTGSRADWQEDAATLREWDVWQRNRHATARAVTSDAANGQQQASAPMIQGNFNATRVTVDQLETNAQKYLGQTVSVDAEVEDVYGPRVFTIDEPNWADLDHEILVYMPTNLAAMVKGDDRVTVTGKVQPFVKADVDREWGWLGVDPHTEITLSKKPVLVASRIVGGNDNMAMMIDVDSRAAQPVGTTGTSNASPVTDLQQIGRSDATLVGRRVDLDNATVASMAKGAGFFVKAGDKDVFVLPANASDTSVKPGDSVSLTGALFQMPDKMSDRLSAPQDLNDDIYIYATQVTK